MRKRAAGVLLLSVWILLTPLADTSGLVPDTNQTQCCDNAAEITCPNPGEAFFGQDGNFSINPPSCTQLDTSGNDLPDEATSWVMVRDNVTGLIRELKQLSNRLAKQVSLGNTYNES